MPGPPPVTVSIASLTANLQQRLGDSTFWGEAELDLYVRQAIREFQCLTNYWRASIQLTTAANEAFYDLHSGPIPYTVQDTDILNQVGYHLLEFSGTQASPINTQQFALGALTAAFGQRREEILGETRLVVTEYAGDAPGPPPGTGRITLSSGVIQVHRVEWFDTPTEMWSLCSRSDEIGAYGWRPGWSQAQPLVPSAYSVAVTRPFQIQFIPPPSNTGKASVLITSAPPYTYMPSAPQLLGIPDDSAYALPWGILASMLSQDAQSRDYRRAAYAARRFHDGLMVLKTWPCVMNSYPQGLQYPPSTLFDMDHWRAGWRNSAGLPDVVGIGGRNLVACSPVPDAMYQIALDCVVNSPASTASRTEAFDMASDIQTAILNNSYHLACVKLGGEEFESTLPLYQDFLGVAQAYADRERAQSINWKALLGQTEEENLERPYEAVATDA